LHEIDKMNIVIDVGNTRSKAGLFLEDRLEKIVSFVSTEELKAFLLNNFFECMLISSVGAPASEIAGWATGVEKKWILTHELPLPIQNKYATPETVGVDRIAAACGAWSLFPGCDCLVIDAGTCITYEIIDRQAAYWGGAISPGLEMRLRAMHKFTARLPLVTINQQVNMVGNSTESCLQSGAWFGAISEIEGMIEKYRQKYPELKVILCGGDAPLFENQLKPTIFAAPDLVLMGLNRILRYNAS
jgi:type III pantothenate kinase